MSIFFSRHIRISTRLEMPKAVAPLAANDPETFGCSLFWFSFLYGFYLFKINWPCFFFSVVCCCVVFLIWIFYNIKSNILLLSFNTSVCLQKLSSSLGVYRKSYGCFLGKYIESNLKRKKIRSLVYKNASMLTNYYYFALEISNIRKYI